MVNGVLLPLLALSWLLMPQGSAPPSDVENQLRQQTQELLDAIAPGRVDVWRKLVHERMIHVDENGVVRRKDQLLDELKPLPAGLEGRLRIASFQVQIHGDVAIATHEDREDLMYFGQKLESRFRTTDTWLRTSEGWRLIAAQVLAVPEDPPALTLDAKRRCAYEGIFALTPDVTATVRCRQGELEVARTGRPAAIYRPETADVFFSPASHERGAFSDVTPPARSRASSIAVKDTMSSGAGFVDVSVAVTRFEGLTQEIIPTKDGDVVSDGRGAENGQ